MEKCEITMVTLFLQVVIRNLHAQRYYLWNGGASMQMAVCSILFMLLRNQQQQRAMQKAK